LRGLAALDTMAAVATRNAGVSDTYRRHIQHLYRATLKSVTDWCRRPQSRIESIKVRAVFESHAQARTPREMAEHLHDLEALELSWRHPNPYIPPSAPGGTKFERFGPPRLFTDLERQAMVAFAKPKFTSESPALPDWYSEVFDHDPHQQYFRKGQIGPELAKVGGRDMRRVVNGQPVIADPMVTEFIAQEEGGVVLEDGVTRMYRLDGGRRTRIVGPPGTPVVERVTDADGGEKIWIDGRPIVGRDDFGSPIMGEPEPQARVAAPH